MVLHQPAKSIHFVCQSVASIASVPQAKHVLNISDRPDHHRVQFQLFSIEHLVEGKLLWSSFQSQLRLSWQCAGIVPSQSKGGTFSLTPTITSRVTFHSIPPSSCAHSATKVLANKFLNTSSYRVTLISTYHANKFVRLSFGQVDFKFCN